jgi:hypothetical protein
MALLKRCDAQVQHIQTLSLGAVRTRRRRRRRRQQQRRTHCSGRRRELRHWQVPSCLKCCLHLNACCTCSTSPAQICNSLGPVSIHGWPPACHVRLQVSGILRAGLCQTLAQWHPGPRLAQRRGSRCSGTCSGQPGHAAAAKATRPRQRLDGVPEVCTAPVESEGHLSRLCRCPRVHQPALEMLRRCTNRRSIHGNDSLHGHESNTALSYIHANNHK